MEPRTIRHRQHKKRELHQRLVDDHVFAMLQSRLLNALSDTTGTSYFMVGKACPAPQRQRLGRIGSKRKPATEQQTNRLPRSRASHTQRTASPALSSHALSLWARFRISLRLPGRAAPTRPTRTDSPAAPTRAGGSEGSDGGPDRRP